LTIVTQGAEPPDHEIDFTIARHGECRIASPMSGVRFGSDHQRVVYASTLNGHRRYQTPDGEPLSMERAGPRERVIAT